MEVMEMGFRRRKGHNFEKNKAELEAWRAEEGRARGNDERGHVLGKGLTGGALGIKKGSHGWVAFEFVNDGCTPTGLVVFTYPLWVEILRSGRVVWGFGGGI
ncbi:hypothetical protein Pyn_02715 [Prunus yedoensis var. nudiflora]|uniref:Uncharacterized protein n=1 Tax=Prunus yedoensis var. nudiflora TaxID=2094558 RepID=A0A314UL23_PRUYE|nr:hypothetical protein Pyn_02715 [Prunus yedoensis var. nudiflora]